MAKKQQVMAKITEKVTEQTIERSVELPKDVAEHYNLVPLPDKGRFGRPFVTVFKDALLYILQYGKLTKNELLLLCYFIASAKADNLVITNLQLISDILGIAKPNVSIAMKGLIKRNIIIKRLSQTNYREPTTMAIEVNFDQLNYNLAFNGKIKQYSLKKIEHPGLTDAEGHLLTDIAAKDRCENQTSTSTTLIAETTEIEEYECQDVATEDITEYKKSE